MVGQRADSVGSGVLREPKDGHDDALGTRNRQPEDAQRDRQSYKPPSTGELASSQCLGPPEYGHHRNREGHDQAAEPHVEVGAIDREQHEGEAQCGVKQRHREHAATGVVAEPDNRDAGRHGVKVPPDDLCRPPLRPGSSRIAARSTAAAAWRGLLPSCFHCGCAVRGSAIRASD